MLYRNLLAEALRSRREEFLRFDRSWRTIVQEYSERLRLLDGLASEEVTRRATGGRNLPPALPTRELDDAGSMVMAFGGNWRAHEEARGWAVDVLSSRTTFAADGSQLMPGRDISMPVAVVQVAWFENSHTRDGLYEKQARSDIISPKELLAGAEDRVNASTVVDLHRFQLEVEETIKFLERKRGWKERGERAPVAFFDGTLLISIALPNTRIQNKYVELLARLALKSRETGVAVVGFVDQSYARDLVRLLDALGGAGGNASDDIAITDAQFLHAATNNAKPLLAGWGDRTAFCSCHREGFQDDAGAPLLGFTYLQTTSDGLPARVDVPLWVYEAGLLDEVVDTVRAECVVGLGYPYAIETADAAAVITARDRAEFLRVVQEFAETETLAFGLSRKSLSKARRR